MPGTVVKVLVSHGQHVEAHQALVVLEAMKMEHVVSAPYAGVVRRVACQAGEMVAKGVVLAEVDAA
jgi:3-methylcrotonyl-CoA carboxylase alpha subunit